jgi:hypothetical protein
MKTATGTVGAWGRAQNDQLAEAVTESKQRSDREDQAEEQGGC